tara:strand:+ start:771 stop:1010 length:240 start_codon:yes stop_codon:yes gene_type:complete
MTQYAYMIKNAARAGSLAQGLDLLSKKLKAEAELLRLEGRGEEAQAKEAYAQVAAEGSKFIDENHFSQIANLVSKTFPK